MDTSLESLHVDGRKCGAIVRRRTPREVRTFVCYRSPQEYFRADASLVHDGDARAWSTYSYSDGDHSLRLTRTPTGVVRDDGSTLPAPADTVPSYAEAAILEDMLAASATEAEFHRLVESAAGEPQPAHFSVGNPEDLHLPDGHEEQLGTAELFVGDEPVHKFWFDSHEIVASDWAGARAYRVQTVEELVEGLDDDVADAVRTFCG